MFDGQKLDKNMIQRLSAVAIVVSLCLGTLASAGCLTRSSQQTGTIYEVWMRSGDMVQQIQTSNIDAFIAWEPIPSRVALTGAGTILAYSSAIWPDHPCCVMVASQDTLQRLDKNALLGLVWAHVIATRYINDPQNSNQTIQYLMNDTGVNRDTARESFNHTKYIDIPSTKAVREVYGDLVNASYPLPSASSLGGLSIEQFLDDFVVNEYADVVHANLALDPNWRPPASNATVRLGLLSGDGHHLAETIALKKGYYENLGLRVVIKQYANGIALVEAFKSREIDVGCCGLPPALLKAINDDVKIRVIEGVNNEGSAVVVRPSTGIKELAELNGKTVATPGAGTLQNLLLRRLAQEFNLTITVK
jgi:NitT/TauT family transport system substrate-binding protein